MNLKRHLPAKILELLNKTKVPNAGPARLATSLCVGIYIAFSPFPGFHTLMIIAIRGVFSLSFPLLFIGASINNPWTIIPFYSLDYFFGYWLTHSVLGWSFPWIIPLEKIFGSGKICLISFLIGGNLLGIVASLVSYPVAYGIFKRVKAGKKLT